MHAAPDAALEHTVTYEQAITRSVTCSTAILDAGLVVELFHEQSYTNAPWPWAEQGDDGYFRLPRESPRFPLTYSLALAGLRTLAVALDHELFQLDPAGGVLDDDADDARTPGWMVVRVRPQPAVPRTRPAQPGR